VPSGSRTGPRVAQEHVEAPLRRDPAWLLSRAVVPVRLRISGLRALITRPIECLVHSGAGRRLGSTPAAHQIVSLILTMPGCQNRPSTGAQPRPPANACA
jgi:hypothetical protein